MDDCVHEMVIESSSLFPLTDQKAFFNPNVKICTLFVRDIASSETVHYYGDSQKINKPHS